MIPIRLTPLLLLLAGIAGCDDNVGIPLPGEDPGAPCTCDPDTAPSGVCPGPYKNAQICPDLSPVQFCSRFIGSTVSTDVILLNRGLQGLRIDSVRLLGDDHCAFAPPELSWGQGSVDIAYQRQAVVRLVYRPGDAVPDYALLRIESSAENFPRLDIAVCGQGIRQGMPQGPDGGACLPCMRPATEKEACAAAPDGGT